MNYRPFAKLVSLGSILVFSLGCSLLAQPLPGPVPPTQTEVQSSSTPTQAKAESTSTLPPQESPTPEPSVTSSPQPTVSPTMEKRVDHNITYCTAGGKELKLDIYYPVPTPNPQPVILYVHGGSWREGSKENNFSKTMGAGWVGQGYLFVSIDYRLAPQNRFPAMIEDVKCAVRFLRANAETFNLNPVRIGAIGDSAGGHLVALLGVTDPSAELEGESEYGDQSSQVQAVVDLYGPADLTRSNEDAISGMLKPVFGTSPETLRQASPIYFVSPDDPPFLIIHGDKDEVVAPIHSQRLYNALSRQGVPVELIWVKNSGHGFSPVGGIIEPSREEINARITEFFNQYLK